MSLINDLRDRGQSLCVAESLTGGALASALVDVPGASEVFLGGVVVYTIQAKREVLGVCEEDLVHGVVSREVAMAMARRARESFCLRLRDLNHRCCRPGPHEGVEPGTVWLGFASKLGIGATRLNLEGDRKAVRAAAVSVALELLASRAGFARIGERS